MSDAAGYTVAQLIAELQKLPSDAVVACRNVRDWGVADRISAAPRLDADGEVILLYDGPELFD